MGPLSVVLGTSGVVFAADERYRPNPAGRLHAFCYAVTDRRHVMGVMLSGAGSLAWARDTLAPDSSFEALLCGAEAWAPGVEGLTCLPYLNGERTPHADHRARAAFTGLSLRHDRPALVRAVLEGVDFGLRDGLDLIQALGVPARRAASPAATHAATRGRRASPRCSSSHSPAWAVSEGAAFGAALLAGVAADVWPDLDAAAAAASARRGDDRTGGHLG